MRTPAAALVFASILAAGTLCGCQRARFGGIYGARGVAAVLPSVISDLPGEQPDEAFLCYSDGDCRVVEVRQCCAVCYPSYLAVNGGAAGCIARYHERNPCPDVRGCPEIGCPEDVVAAAPTAVCRRNRCALMETP
jgi:hypothetical protein